MDGPPLIVTLTLDEASFTFFDTLRRKHFPPSVNFIAAHLTLFHHLPAANSSIVQDIISSTRHHTRFPLSITDVVSIGKGVAYKAESLQLMQMHYLLQKKWKAFLTSQDRQKLWPHITIQNKVSPDVARQTLLQLKDSFESFTVMGIGLSLYSYEGGPWKLAQHFPFRETLAS
jgi:hypothetical protein